MDFKKLAFFILILISSSCAVSEDKTLEMNRFNDYALLICYGSAFNDSEVKQDFNRGANGVMEDSNISLDAYEELRILISNKLEENYPSKHGGQVQSLKCLDLIKNPAFHEIFNKFNPCKNKDSWLDESAYESSCKKL